MRDILGLIYAYPPLARTGAGMRLTGNYLQHETLGVWFN